MQACVFTRRRWSRTATAAALAAVASAAGAEGYPTFNESALARGFALPEVGLTDVPSSGEARGSITLDLTSEYVDEHEGDEALLLDGETQRYTFRFREGFGYGWEWNVGLPVVHTGGGFLDKPVEDWHDLFNLSDGGRGDAPRDRFDYRYVRNGNTRFHASNGGTGIGDVRIGIGRPVAEGLVARAQIKLPTGDEDHLSGGGNLGGALWLDYALPLPRTFLGLTGFLSGGVSGQRDDNSLSHELASLQRPVIPFASAGVSIHVLPSLEVMTQVYGHTPLYRNTDLNALERPGLQLVVGGRLCVSMSTCFELALQEDPIVASSPDFSLHFGLVVQ